MIDFRKSTALFGGAFDPVHSGHVHVAREVSRLKPDLEQILFVPAWQSPGKPNPKASAAERLHWLELALKGTAFHVWSWELQRHHESFTVETLEEAHRLGAEKPRLYWVLGGDAYQSFEKWRHPDRIRELCRLLVVHRSGSPFLAHDPEDILLSIQPHPMSSTKIRDALRAGNPPPGAFPHALERHFLDLGLKNPYSEEGGRE